MSAFALTRQSPRRQLRKSTTNPPTTFGLLPAIIMPRMIFTTDGAMRRTWRLQKEELKRNADHFFST